MYFLNILNFFDTPANKKLHWFSSSSNLQTTFKLYLPSKYWLSVSDLNNRQTN